MALSTHNSCIYIFRQRFLFCSPSDQHGTHERAGELMSARNMFSSSCVGETERDMNAESRMKHTRKLTKMQYAHSTRNWVTVRWWVIGLFYSIAARRAKCLCEFLHKPPTSPQNGALFSLSSTRSLEQNFSWIIQKKTFSFSYICFS